MKNMTVKEFSVDHEAIVRVLEALKSLQAIVVTGEKGCHADLYLYEFNNQSWVMVDKMQANIGQNGFGKAREGDQKSPVGIYSLASAFGLAPPPEGANYPYRMLTPEDYWVDDSQSKSYNRWARFKDGYWKDWNSAECLGRETVAYKHAVIINYNSARQPGKGSAIFLHVRIGEDIPTRGCTAVSEADMVRILQWLDCDKRPVVIQGSIEELMANSREQFKPPMGLPDGFVYVDDLIPDIFIDIRNSTEGSLPNVAILTVQAARALAEAQRKLCRLDLSIKIMDAYRPQQSAGSHSAHHRGSAVDVTLVDLKTGQEPDMGEENRTLLRDIMEDSGFMAEAGEWWHFTLGGEPFPGRYFDFPVGR